jgi:hypothetical protein
MKLDALFASQDICFSMGGAEQVPLPGAEAPLPDFVCTDGLFIFQ